MKAEDLLKGAERMHLLNKLLVDMPVIELKFLHELLPSIIVDKMLETDKYKNQKNEDDNWVYHPWASYYVSEEQNAFTCDNWYCRRGFKKGVWNKETDYILCYNCYQLYKFFDAHKDYPVSFEFVKKPHAVLEKERNEKKK